MRVLRSLALVGLLLGTFLNVEGSISSSVENVFSSSDNAVETKNNKVWPEANAWLHAQLSDTEREFLSSQMSLSATGSAVKPILHSVPSTSQEIPYCSSHLSACLNGGTCINGSTYTTYTCQCASAFIGTNCQYAIFPNSKRSSNSKSGGVARGSSVTRPNVQAKPKLPTPA